MSIKLVKMIQTIYETIKLQYIYTVVNVWNYDENLSIPVS